MNLARTDELMDAMVDAGFSCVFLGIETPNPRALIKMKKPQNTSRKEGDYLLHSVLKIQRKGIQVQGGFILGVDGDDADVFDAQIRFIQEAGIPMAMIGLLTVLKGTGLYDRLKRENRLLEESTGSSAEAVLNLTSVNVALNFKPEMDPETLIEGYRRVITTIYDPTLENYFERCLRLFERLPPIPHLQKPRSRNALFLALMAVRQRLSARQIPAFGKFIARVSKDHSGMLPEAIRLAALGYHYERIARQQIAIHDFKKFLAVELERFTEAVPQRVQAGEAIASRRQELLTRVDARYRSIPDAFRYGEDGIEPALESFRLTLEKESV